MGFGIVIQISTTNGRNKMTTTMPCNANLDFKIKEKKSILTEEAGKKHKHRLILLISYFCVPTIYYSRLFYSFL